jgi:Ni/Fe-hydrogenase 1 B-type cytochrome subunit
MLTQNKNPSNDLTQRELPLVLEIMSEKTNSTLAEHLAWDKTTRWFHWINVLSVFGLMIVGTIILNGKMLGVSGEGKILLKEIHVLTGYVFITNLAWRLIWAFIGTPSARWKAILPAGKGYFQKLNQYLAGLKSGNTPGYVGHNPLGRLMVTLLLLLLTVQGVTGLVIAGTDIYYPPFGDYFADWVTGGDAERLANLTAGSKEFVVKEDYDAMRAFRKPFMATHLYTYYVLLGAIFIHIFSVVLAEIKERNGIISAMFTGRKVLGKTPVDSSDS